eukprot:scaffold4527_cov133-Isochrysis_galbana.AAC.5
MGGSHVRHSPVTVTAFGGRKVDASIVNLCRRACPQAIDFTILDPWAYEEDALSTGAGYLKKHGDDAKSKKHAPSALGLSGACGVVAYTLASLSTLTPLSPLTPYRPPPSYSCTDGSYKPEGGGGGLCALPQS